MHIAGTGVTSTVTSVLASTLEVNGRKGRIRSGHYRASKELYESTPSLKRTGFLSPSGCDRSDSDMEDTTVSAISDHGHGHSHGNIMAERAKWNRVVTQK